MNLVIAATQEVALFVKSNDSSPGASLAHAGYEYVVCEISMVLEGEHLIVKLTEVISNPDREIKLRSHQYRVRPAAYRSEWLDVSNHPWKGIVWYADDYGSDPDRRTFFNLQTPSDWDRFYVQARYPHRQLPHLKKGKITIQSVLAWKHVPDKAGQKALQNLWAEATVIPNHRI